MIDMIRNGQDWSQFMIDIIRNGQDWSQFMTGMVRTGFNLRHHWLELVSIS